LTTNTTVTSGLTNSTTYFWQVTATNADGSFVASNGPFQFTTLPVAPVASFTAGPTAGEVPLTVNFTNNSTGVITSQSCSFGDGGSSSATSPSHTYTNAGTFTVILSVFGQGGTDTQTQVNFITATNIPPPSLVVTPASQDFGTLMVGETN